MGPPAISNDVVYVGGTGNNVYAINASTGMSIWNFTAGIVGSPAVNNGIVYLALVNESVYALNASTRELVWSYDSDQLQDSALAIADWTSDIITSSPIISDGILYVTSGDGNAFALNETTGTLIWDYLAYGAVTSPAVCNGFVYFSSQPRGSSNATIHALNARTGISVWDFNLGFRVASSPAVAYGMVYVSSKTTTPLAFGPPPAGRFYAFNATNGNVVWSINSIKLQPTIANGTVYVSNEAYNALTGAYIRNYNAGETGQHLYSIVAGDILFVNVQYNPSPPAWWNESSPPFPPPYGRSTLAFNVTTGSLLWNYRFNETYGSFLAAANGVLYVSSWTSKLYAFGPESQPAPTPTMPLTSLAQIPDFGWMKIVLILCTIFTVLFVAILLLRRKLQIIKKVG